MSAKLKYFIIIWTIVSISFWWIYSIFVEYIALGLYMPLFFGLIAVPEYFKKDSIEKRVKNWKLKPLLKFMILGYFMVLLEEVIAWIVNHLLEVNQFSEKFSLVMMITRILQYQFFNLFAFTGLIFGIYISIKIFNYSRKEMLFVAWLWWLYVEKVVSQVVINPAYVILTIIPTILIYAAIIYPSLLSIDFPKQKSKLNNILKYILTLIIIYISCVIPMLIVSIVRTNYPFLFPPERLLGM